MEHKIVSIKYFLDKELLGLGKNVQLVLEQQARLQTGNSSELGRRDKRTFAGLALKTKDADFGLAFAECGSNRSLLCRVFWQLLLEYRFNFAFAAAVQQRHLSRKLQSRCAK